MPVIGRKRMLFHNISFADGFDLTSYRPARNLHLVTAGSNSFVDWLQAAALEILKSQAVCIGNGSS